MRVQSFALAVHIRSLRLTTPFPTPTMALQMHAEQGTGQEGSVRADPCLNTWSLGVTSYLCLTGLHSAALYQC